MKAIYLLAALISLSTAASAQVHVQGHFRQNGTYVQPHYRSAPDSNPYNNYSTQGNVNPYTGQEGHVQPYQQQPSFKLDNSMYRQQRCGAYDQNCQ